MLIDQLQPRQVVLPRMVQQAFDLVQRVEHRTGTLHFAQIVTQAHEMWSQQGHARQQHGQLLSQ